jgi:hypothetical protein
LPGVGRGEAGDLEYGTMDVAGPQFLPARVIGPVPRHLDATGILLKMVCADSPPGVSGDAAGPPG